MYFKKLNVFRKLNQNIKISWFFILFWSYYCSYFTYTGVDYFGSCMVQSNDKIIKIWTCIFVCMTTSSIHLEITESLSAELFLNCFKRFALRRGFPKVLYSDNGTNFLPAKNYLRIKIKLTNTLTF